MLFQKLPIVLIAEVSKEKKCKKKNGGRLLAHPVVQFVDLLLHCDANSGKPPRSEKGGCVQFCCEKYLLRVSL